MFGVMGVMIIGICIGYALRSQKKIQPVIGRITLYTIFLLLFFMGISIGNNKEIIHNLGGLGLQAIIIAVASTTGSVLLAWLLFRTLFNKHNRP